MARRKIKRPTQRSAANRRRVQSHYRRRFELRWIHLIAGCVGAFCLGYLVAAAQITSYAAGIFDGP